MRASSPAGGSRSVIDPRLPSGTFCQSSAKTLMLKVVTMRALPAPASIAKSAASSAQGAGGGEGAPPAPARWPRRWRNSSRLSVTCAASIARQAGKQKNGKSIVDLNITADLLAAKGRKDPSPSWTREVRSSRAKSKPPRSEEDPGRPFRRRSRTSSRLALSKSQARKAAAVSSWVFAERGREVSAGGRARRRRRRRGRCGSRASACRLSPSTRKRT